VFLTNNRFTTDIYVYGRVLFDATAGVITAPVNVETEGFAAGDDIYVYGSFKNDGFVTIATVATNLITVSSDDTIVNEPSGRNVYLQVVSWPKSLAYAAAQLVKFDYDDRASYDPQVASESLGPHSVSYRASGESFGYPHELLTVLEPFKMVGML